MVCVEPPEPPAGVDIEVLAIEELAIYRPEGTPAGAPESWGPWVLFPTESHSRTVIADALRHKGATVEVIAESHQPDVLREMVELGLGWTVLPVVQAGGDGRGLTRGRILTTRRLVVAVRSGSVLDPAVGALKDALFAA